MSAEQELDGDSIRSGGRARAMRSKGRRPSVEPRDDGEPRLRPGDTIVIRVRAARGRSARRHRTAEEQERSTISAIGSRKAIRISSTAPGCLYLPGVPAIALAGLDVDEATVRVQAETAAATVLRSIVTFLPLEPSDRGARAVRLRPVRALATRVRCRTPISRCRPTTCIGPGDTVNVQLFGNQNIEYFLPVSREGTINFPEIGPINVSGLTFEQMRDTIERTRDASK